MEREFANLDQVITALRSAAAGLEIDYERIAVTDETARDERLRELEERKERIKARIAELEAELEG